MSTWLNKNVHRTWLKMATKRHNSEKSVVSLETYLLEVNFII